MRELKASTSKHVNETISSIAKFGWQDGYGVFTVSPSQKQKLIHYIDNQESHHSKENFQTEYTRLLDLHEIEYDAKYLWN